MIGGRIVETELPNGTEEIGLYGLQMPIDIAKGFVNIADFPKENGRLEIVNNRERKYIFFVYFCRCEAILLFSWKLVK